MDDLSVPLFQETTSWSDPVTPSLPPALSPPRPRFRPEAPAAHGPLPRRWGELQSRRAGDQQTGLDVSGLSQFEIS